MIRDYKHLIKLQHIPYPYGTNTFKGRESEILSKYKLLLLMIMQMKTKENTI